MLLADFSDAAVFHPDEPVKYEEEREREGGREGERCVFHESSLKYRAWPEVFELGLF